MSEILTVSKLRKKFGGVHAVENLHFKVKRNTITGLIGPNGAGKTTAFNLITRFLPCDGGVVIFNNKKLPRLRPSRIVRLGLARTFQQVRLCPTLTVRENLLLSASRKYDRWWHCFMFRDETKENQIVENLLKTLSLEMMIDSPAGDLSYGQSKLVEIARAFLTDAEMILLDEPAAGINPTLLCKVEEMISDLKKQGKTILIIEHNMPFLMRISDEIIAMDNGKFLCQGTPEEVQQNPELLAAYLGGNLQTSN